MNNRRFSDDRAQILFGKLVEHLGFLSPKKVNKALQLYSQAPGDYSVGEIFIHKKYLTSQQVMDLGDLLNKALRKLQEIVYSKVTVEKGVIPEGFLYRELENLGDFHASISRTLRERNMITEELHQALEEEQCMRIGEMPLENLILAVLKIVNEMKESGKPAFMSLDDIVGERAVGLGWISTDQLREAQSLQIIIGSKGYYRPVGEVLAEMGGLSPEKYRDLREGVSVISSPIKGYQVLQKVGQGAMGVVYKAILVKNNQEVALKILLPKFARNREDLGRFLRSAHLSTNLNHRNLIRTYDVGKCEEFYYQALEFVRGESVLEYMKRHGPLDEVICLTIVAEVTSALAYLDSHGLVHRDVKPHNIMMTHMGETKLTDLGILREKEGKHMITEDGISIGSPHYISPEQVMGETVDIRSDFYSLGATMYHMLIAEYPYQGKSGPEILFKQVHDPPPNALLKRPDLAKETVVLIIRMMAKDPEERFQKPIELLNTIRQIILKVSRR